MDEDYINKLNQYNDMVRIQIYVINPSYNTCNNRYILQVAESSSNEDDSDQRRYRKENIFGCLYYSASNDHDRKLCSAVKIIFVVLLHWATSI